MECIFPPGGYFIRESDVAACVSGGGQHGAFTGLVGIELFCSSRVAGFLHYLPVDYGLHLSSLSSSSNLSRLSKKAQLIRLFIAAAVVRK